MCLIKVVINICTPRPKMPFGRDISLSDLPYIDMIRNLGLCGGGEGGWGKGAVVSDALELQVQGGTFTSLPRQRLMNAVDAKASATVIVGRFYQIKSLVQWNLVISNSLISNYRLSRSENLVPVLT